MLTAIIPTRNRPFELLNAIRSLCIQSRLPDELIVIDQSIDNKSGSAIANLMRKFKQIKLLYVYDPKILGLVDAKRISLGYASGDIICFLEDDIVLETDYIQQIELGFKKNANMLGCCGIITNPPAQNFLYRAMFTIFHRGIFKDKRIEVHGNFRGHNNYLIESNALSGGISAWRREVFDSVKFDVMNDFHMFEDIDFSTRVAQHYGKRLFINPNARLAHYYSPINRDALYIRQRRKMREFFTYYKKRKDWPNAMISFFWLILGMIIVSIFESFLSMSFRPIQYFLLGLRDGFEKKIIS